MLHGLPIVYARWFSPERVQKSGDLEAIEEGMSDNVIKDFDWLEGELQKSSGKFLVGSHITAADCMMIFSVQYILDKVLGTKAKKWPKIEEWVKNCEAMETWKKAVQKTGHSLNPKI